MTWATSRTSKKPRPITFTIVQLTYKQFDLLTNIFGIFVCFVISSSFFSWLRSFWFAYIWFSVSNLYRQDPKHVCIMILIFFSSSLSFLYFVCFLWFHMISWSVSFGLCSLIIHLTLLTLSTYMDYVVYSVSVYYRYLLLYFIIIWYYPFLFVSLVLIWSSIPIYTCPYLPKQ